MKSAQILLICLVFIFAGFSMTHAATLGGPTNTNDSSLTGPTNTGSSPSQTVTLINPLKGGSNIKSFLSSILAFVVSIGSIVVILMLVFVGFKFVTAQGEPGKITEARQMLLWTVVGALILLGAQAIASGIEATVQALSVGG
jgi:hypothetical protein